MDKNKFKKNDCPVNFYSPFENTIEVEASQPEADRSLEIGDQGFLNIAERNYEFSPKMNFDIRDYPYDVHYVPAVLDVREGWSLEKGRKQSSFCPRIPEIGNEEIPSWIDKTKFDKMLPIITLEANKYAKNEIQCNHCPLVLGTSLCLKMERDPIFSYKSIVLPTFFVVSFVLMSVRVRYDLDEKTFDGKGTMDTLAVGLLTSVASQVSLADNLPKKAYITNAAKYLVFSYTYLFAIGIIAIFITEGVIDEDESILLSNVWFSFVGVWLSIHLLLLFDCQFEIVRKYFRNKGWDRQEDPRYEMVMRPPTIEE